MSPAQLELERLKLERLELERLLREAEATTAQAQARERYALRLARGESDRAATESVARRALEAVLIAVFGGSMSAVPRPPLARLTVSIGDDNGNGQTDVALALELFGRVVPWSFVVDLPTLDARSAAQGLATLVGRERPALEANVKELLETVRRSTPGG